MSVDESVSRAEHLLEELLPTPGSVASRGAETAKFSSSLSTIPEQTQGSEASSEAAALHRSHAFESIGLLPESER